MLIAIFAILAGTVTIIGLIFLAGWLTSLPRHTTSFSSHYHNNITSFTQSSQLQSYPSIINTSNMNPIPQSPSAFRQSTHFNKPSLSLGRNSLLNIDKSFMGSFPNINQQQLQALMQIVAKSNKPREINNLLLDSKFHGTVSEEIALNIFYGKNWIVGDRAANGRGVYLASKATAKAYTGASGALVYVLILAPKDQFISYDTVYSSPDFKKYLTQNSTLQHGDAITNYTTGVLGKRFIRAGKDIVVALAPKTKPNERVVFEGLFPICVFDINGSVIS